MIYTLTFVDVLVYAVCTCYDYQLFSYSGQGAVLRRHNISGDHFCSEFETMELQGEQTAVPDIHTLSLSLSLVADDRESLLYIATLMGTVGRILKNLGLLKEVTRLITKTSRYPVVRF